MASGRIMVTKNNFPKVKKSALGILASALQEEVELLMTRAKRYYVPVLFGPLRASGFVKPVNRMSSSTAEVEAGFGQAGTPASKYAVIVHERPASIGQGKNKYWEKPVKEWSRVAQRNLSRRVQSKINSRWG